jgi:hypothetical protein
MRSVTVSIATALVTLCATFLAPQAKASALDSQMNGPELHVSGEVEMLTPTEIILATRDGMRDFAITPQTATPVPFAKGDYIEVFYRVVPGQEKPMLTHATRQQRPMASTNSSMLLPEHHIQGEVQVKTPDEIALGTDRGVMKFAVTGHTETPLAFAKGDEVELWYRNRKGGKVAEVTRVARVRPVAPAVPAASSSTLEPQEPLVARNEEPAAKPLQGLDKTSPMKMASAAPVEKTTQGGGTLPKTASDLPLIGLLGLASLATAVILRLVLRA